MKNKENLVNKDPFLDLIAELHKDLALGNSPEDLSTQNLPGINQGAASSNAPQKQPSPEVPRTHQTPFANAHYTPLPTSTFVGQPHAHPNGQHNVRQTHPQEGVDFVNAQTSRDPFTTPSRSTEASIEADDVSTHTTESHAHTSAATQTVRQAPLPPDTLLQQPTPSIPAQPQKSAAGNASVEVAQPNIWRDPMDAATIQRQSLIIILQAVALVIVTAICVYLVRRVPDRIVIDRSSGRVVQINNREYGATEAVEMTPDNPGVPDRLYLAKTWCDWFFTIDRATRARQLERVFALMEPAGRRALARWLQERGELDTERAESWQAIWKVLDAQADRRDPYLIRILGEQQISRLTHQANISSGLQTFRRQINITLKLVADPEGRADRNLRTGYLVAWVDARQVGVDEPVNQNPNQSAETNQSNQSNAPVPPVPTQQNPVPADNQNGQTR